MSRRAVPLDALLRRWVAESLISADQAAAIRHVERVDLVDVPGRVAALEPAAERTPLVIEALGYLGGVIILLAATLVTVQFWADISTGVRVTVALVATAALLAAGLALPRRAGGLGEPVGRLVAVLLALGVGGVAASLALVGNEVLDLAGNDTGLLVSFGAAAAGGALWWLRPSVVQQAVTVAALLASGAVLTARFDGDSSLPGLAVWVGALAYLLLGWGEVLEPRRAVILLASVWLLVGAVMTMGSDPGLALGILTTVAITALALLVRDLALLAVAAVSAFLVLPTVMNTWFPGSLAAPVALLLLGLVLVGAAFLVARNRREGRQVEPARELRRGDRTFGVTAAATTVVVGATVIAGLLVLG
jgi:hypothetical protein